ncbi:MAG: hypothetical protein ACREA0_09785 [bacterium]
MRALVAHVRDIVAVLADADLLDERAIYEELGVKFTYYPDGRVHVGAGAPHVLGVRVGGGTQTLTPRLGLEGTFNATAQFSGPLPPYPP